MNFERNPGGTSYLGVADLATAVTWVEASIRAGNGSFGIRKHQSFFLVAHQIELIQCLFTLWSTLDLFGRLCFYVIYSEQNSQNLQGKTDWLAIVLGAYLPCKEPHFNRSEQTLESLESRPCWSSGDEHERYPKMWHWQAKRIATHTHTHFLNLFNICLCRQYVRA